MSPATWPHDIESEVHVNRSIYNIKTYSLVSNYLDTNCVTKYQLAFRTERTGIKKQESPADAGIPARRKNDEKNSSISKL